MILVAQWQINAQIMSFVNIYFVFFGASTELSASPSIPAEFQFRPFIDLSRAPV